MKKSSFQTILIVVFGAAFLFAIIVFSGFVSIGSSSKKTTTPQGNVVVWGVLPEIAMETYVNNFNSGGNGYTVSYEEHDPANFYQDLILALANGKQPDVLIYNSEIFSQFADKLYTIPYAAYSERLYRTTNIDGAQIFLTPTGIVGLPLLVDPLVVYYNKDLLAAKNFLTPPSTWTVLTQSVPLFTTKAEDGSIQQATIALGGTTNVEHARDILSALFLQAGNQIISFDTGTNKSEATLNANGAASTAGAIQASPTAQALSFYTNFENPTSSFYSWNSSLPDSLDMFLSGQSVFYIGRASELFTIQAQNPNLNFDVMPLFQNNTTARPITFGSYIAAGMLKNAPNQTAAYAFISSLATAANIDTLSKAYSLPPVRRDLLGIQQNNPYVSVFFQAAVNAFAWPDPNPTATQQIFYDMIDNVNSGKDDPQSALDQATHDLQTNIQ